MSFRFFPGTLAGGQNNPFSQSHIHHGLIAKQRWLIFREVVQHCMSCKVSKHDDVQTLLLCHLWNTVVWFSFYCLTFRGMMQHVVSKKWVCVCVCLYSHPLSVTSVRKYLDVDITQSKVFSDPTLTRFFEVTQLLTKSAATTIEVNTFLLTAPVLIPNVCANEFSHICNMLRFV